jgi:biopolymer transport protein ExbB/TolQ
MIAANEMVRILERLEEGVLAMFEVIAEHYRDGSYWMYPISLFQIFSFAIIIERFYVLYVKARLNKDRILAGVREKILKGDVMGGIRFLSDQPSTPLTRILKSGLMHVQHGEEEVQAAMDEAVFHEMPTFERRIGYLAMIANGATLAGLLGTIFGMIKVFAAVSSVAASDKALLLSSGISEAMNCTAYGLITAIPPLVVYAFYQARIQEINDEIAAGVASTVNFVVRNKSKLDLKALSGMA